MSESRELRALRAQAWERAKGELKSILHTYYDYNECHQKYSELMQEFIMKVQNNGYHE